ncbi:Transcriptional regulator hosA (plasmid) [Pantoea vagans C9-1]|jgi:DNA-binding MarR family transcriptional regulator|uniref:MarR family winged helix-turn-helix transcriptional regulator n=1 Tax=Pantoea vagans TaxID=470934 RepID=UPI0001D8EE8A|nr:MarR family transcriptional regulator [Pantoea vagans]ADI78473.1 Transcriptional regulator hosA [Pantoea vagans C9-1]
MNNDLGNVFFHLSRQLLQEHTAMWQQNLPDLTKQQFAVLCAVSAKPGIEQMELMEAALSSKATLAELLVRMEKKALIRREEGEKDRRRRFITLTAAGEKILIKAMPLADKVDSHFLNRLGQNQQNELVYLMKTLLKQSNK